MNATQPPNYKNTGVYLTDRPRSRPRERDIQQANLISAQAARLPTNARVLDVGCAAGEMDTVLAARFPSYLFTGIDPARELIDKAKADFPAGDFRVGSALSLPEEFRGTFDVVLCSGVLGIFDEADASTVIDNLLTCARAGGLIYVFANFNDYPADVLIRYRKWRDATPGEWETGWNTFSRLLISEWLAGKAQTWRFIPFDLSIDLPFQDDPSRTWTIRNADNQLLVTNGLRVLANLQFLEIVKSKA